MGTSSAMESLGNMTFSVVFGILCIISASNACSCEPATREQSFCSMDTVFRGKVELIITTGEPPFDQKNVSVVRVFEVFKHQLPFEGAKGHVVEKGHLVPVHARLDGGLCGVTIKDQTEYLIEAYYYDGMLWATLCSYTAQWARLNPDVKALYRSLPGKECVDPYDQYYYYK